MITKSLIGAVVALIVAFLLFLGYQGKVSRSGNAAGMIDGKLTACPGSPNCVCSEYADAGAHFINAIPFSGTVDEALALLAERITAASGEVITSQANYLAATFTSSLFGFVDDVEFRVDVEEQVIHVRSASRVGYSDMGANRKRIEAIQVQFSAKRG